MSDYIPIRNRVTGQQVKQMREEDGYGMQDCKRILYSSHLVNEIAQVEDVRLRDILETMITISRL